VGHGSPKFFYESPKVLLGNTSGCLSRLINGQMLVSGGLMATASKQCQRTNGDITTKPQTKNKHNQTKRYKKYAISSYS